MTIALAGLLAGMVHVLSGPDHMAAIAPYAVRDKARSWRTGARWGLGHATGVLSVGLLVLLTRHALPVDALSAHSELAVGIVLIGIGVWGMRAALRGQELHRHRHGRAAIAVGALHGLAGSSHLLGIVPALALPSDGAAAAYLLCFGVGSVVSMGGFSSFIGWIADWRIVGGGGGQRALLGLSSVIATAVGAFWVFSRTHP